MWQSLDSAQLFEESKIDTAAAGFSETHHYARALIIAAQLVSKGVLVCSSQLTAVALSHCTPCCPRLWAENTPLGGGDPLTEEHGGGCCYHEEEAHWHRSIRRHCCIAGQGHRCQCCSGWCTCCWGLRPWLLPLRGWGTMAVLSAVDRSVAVRTLCC